MNLFYLIMILCIYLVDVKFKLDIFQTLFGILITVIFYIFYIIFTLHDVYLLVKQKCYRNHR
jgi:hypothetical protein